MEQLYGEGTAGSMVDSSKLVFTPRRQGYGEGADERHFVAADMALA